MRRLMRRCFFLSLGNAICIHTHTHTAADTHTHTNTRPALDWTARWGVEVGMRCRSWCRAGMLRRGCSSEGRQQCGANPLARAHNFPRGEDLNQNPVVGVIGESREAG